LVKEVERPGCHDLARLPGCHRVGKPSREERGEPRAPILLFFTFVGAVVYVGLG
jgi:hypothetical protein